ncbi:MAG: helical backbone metal receptor [Pseudomonadota bacterium]
MAIAAEETRRDAGGVIHAPAKGNARIVSLVPSVTELLFDLGLGNHIVGRTHYCIHPKEGVARVPSLGGTKKIRMERLQELRPSHAIVNVDENPRAMAEAIAEAGIEVIVTHPLAPLDNLPLYRLMGSLFDREAEAERLSARFLEAYAELAAAAEDWPNRKVLYLIWQDPWMTVARDTYIAATLALLHWQTVGNEGPERYPTIEISRVCLKETDLVLFPSEPYAFTPADVEAFRARFACEGVRLARIDGEMTSWYGSRAIQGLCYLRDFAERIQREAS